MFKEKLLSELEQSHRIMKTTKNGVNVFHIPNNLLKSLQASYFQLTSLRFNKKLQKNIKIFSLFYIVI